MATMWPPAFRQVVDVIGEKAARAIVRRYGGVELYVPRHVDIGHPIVELIGLEVAQRLAREFGPMKMHPPLLKRSNKAEIGTASGSTFEVARRFGVTQRWVRMCRNGK
ncbi:MAG: hypothetical protein ACREH3_17915 [Geminicoccales bacterium]